MSDNKQKDENKKRKNANKKEEVTAMKMKKMAKKCRERPAEFRLVLWMLLSLSCMIVLLIVLAYFSRGDGKFINYTKWVLPALLGAFGAWIGAGAAYFFGKENLKLSNQHTREALEIQKETSKTIAERALIEDMDPTPLNPQFKFALDSRVDEVLSELDKNVAFWFIPILEKGKVKDVIHNEALWRFYKETPKDQIKDKKISDVINFIETNSKAKEKAGKLHGFFEEFKMDDTVGYVHKLMKRSDKSVGIICDDKGDATHCFSRKDLRIFLLGGG